MKKATFALAALAVLGTAGVASAQSPIPLSVEVRGDAAFPTGDFGNRLENGVGFTASAALQLVPGFGAYGSYSRTEFSADGGGDVMDQGFAAGLTASLGGGGGRATPYVGAGLVFHELELNEVEQGDAKMGFEVGAGLAVPLGQRIRVTPGVGYRQYSVENTTLGGLLSSSSNVSYLTAGVGLNIAF